MFTVTQQEEWGLSLEDLDIAPAAPPAFQAQTDISFSSSPPQSVAKNDRNLRADKTADGYRIRSVRSDGRNSNYGRKSDFPYDRKPPVKIIRCPKNDGFDRSHYEPPPVANVRIPETTRSTFENDNRDGDLRMVFTKTQLEDRDDRKKAIFYDAGNRRRRFGPETRVIANERRNPDLPRADRYPSPPKFQKRSNDDDDDDVRNVQKYPYRFPFEPFVRIEWEEENLSKMFRINRNRCDRTGSASPRRIASADLRISGKFLQSGRLQPKNGREKFQPNLSRGFENDNRKYGNFCSGKNGVYKPNHYRRLNVERRQNQRNRVFKSLDHYESPDLLLRK